MSATVAFERAARLLASRATLRNAAGAPEGLIAALVDVSDRLQAQRKAEATQKLLQDITDGVPGAVYQYLQPADGPPRFGFVSGGCEELLGVPAEVLLDNYQAAFAAVVKGPGEPKPEWLAYL